MADGRAPISSSRIATGDIARHSFAVVRRGFDPDEVRSYLQSVARSLEALEEHERELRTALSEAEERAAHPVVDEATLTASLGQHSAQILRHAHEEAARIVAQAQESSAAMLREAQSQADELQARSEASSAERVVEIELVVANAQEEARLESERVIADAVSEGEAILGRAKDEGRTLLEQVQEARRRVLAELTGRRRTVGMQIEALRAARDEMAAAVHGVRDRVEGILAELERTDDEARAAAMAVSDQFRLHGPTEGAAEDAALEGDVGEAMDDVISEPATSGEGGPEGSSDAGEGAAAPSVDELFARIRAGSHGAAGAPPAASGPATAKRPRTSGAGDDTPPGGTPPATEAVEGIGAEAEPVATAAPSTAPPEPEQAPAGPDDLLIARRDELLVPITARLSRSVKRTLGDDQNRLLDKLRSAPALSADELLGDEAEHVETFAAASRSHLSNAFAAGTAFGGTAAVVPEGDAAERSAHALALAVVTMLRRQIGDGGGDAADRVGAVYREWRGERVERLAGDCATQAFSAGVVAAGTDGKVRWVVTNAGGCSDCADNALGGAVSVHETFPTGHAHPPAHSGCRCLVTPTDA
jgi:DivIVA domain-containing protein